MSVWGVTGATGFIGQHLCRHLLDRGERVVALVRPESSAGQMDSRAEVRRVNLDDPSGLQRALTGIEIGVHLAAPRRTVRRRQGTPTRHGLRGGSRETMVDAVAALLTAGSRAGMRRLVLASSTAVFGHTWRAVGDHDRPGPDTPYGRDRLAGEETAALLGSQLSVETVVARLSEVFGPGSSSHGPLFLSVARGGFRVIGDGRHAHQLAYVDDAVRALDACGRLPGAAGKALLVSGPRITLREWIGGIAMAAGTSVRYFGAAGGPARALLHALGSVPIHVGGSRRLAWDYMLRPRAYDVRRSLEVLGPYQGSDLNRGIEATLAWYRAHDFSN